MPRRISRMPQLGDVIVETCPYNERSHVGIVYDIKRDSWGHQSNVMIEWTGDTKPYSYNTRHGYSGVNIHNVRTRFNVIRNGVSIK